MRAASKYYKRVENGLAMYAMHTHSHQSLLLTETNAAPSMDWVKGLFINVNQQKCLVIRWMSLHRLIVGCAMQQANFCYQVCRTIKFVNKVQGTMHLAVEVP